MITEKAKQDLVKITRRDFYDIYAISLVAHKLRPVDAMYMSEILQTVAEKYYDVTLYAVRAEIRYVYNRTWNAERDVAKRLGRFGISGNIQRRATRAKIDFKAAEKLFKSLNWDDNYGGMAWGDIAKAGRKLEALMPVLPSNIGKVVSALDHLNDLAHNTDLYLSQYATFNLHAELDRKYECGPQEVLKLCSQEVRDICEEYVI